MDTERQATWLGHNVQARRMQVKHLCESWGTMWMRLYSTGKDRCRQGMDNMDWTRVSMMGFRLD